MLRIYLQLSLIWELLPTFRYFQKRSLTSLIVGTLLVWLSKNHYIYCHLIGSNHLQEHHRCGMYLLFGLDFFLNTLCYVWWFFWTRYVWWFFSEHVIMYDGWYFRVCDFTKTASPTTNKVLLFKVPWQPVYS
jgi:hypothetical protein